MNGLKVTDISRAGIPLPASVEISASYPSADEADFDGTPGVAGASQWKEPVRAATTANITIATALNAGDTLDGVTLAAGDRVLVKDQGTASQNGIYVVDATPYRAGDMDDDTEVLGAVVYVIAGTANAGTSWKVTNTAATVVDTDAINFAAFGGSTSFGTPAIVLGTAAAAGAATTAVRTDATIVAFDATAPTTQALGDAAATGSAAVAARRDHKHAMPAAAVTTSGLTQATGKLLGRSTAGTGAIEEITVSTGLSLSGGSLVATGSGGSITVEEVDGSPTDSAVTKIVFPNGTLGIASHVATYTPAAGGGDTSGQLAGGFDGGGSAITAGSIYYGVVPFDGTITDWIIQASSSSNATFDVALAAAGTRPTFPGDSIVASAPPSMTADDDAASSTLTGWTTSITAGQRYAVKFVSGTATWAQLILNYSRP